MVYKTVAVFRALILTLVTCTMIFAIVVGVARVLDLREHHLTALVQQDAAWLLVLVPATVFYLALRQPGRHRQVEA